MAGKLNGKVAIVTGAASGIGKAIASAFADEGADIAVVDLQEAKGQAVVKTLKDKGRKSVFIKANASESREVSDMMNEVVKTLGGIDIMVNNAAVIRQSSLLDTTDELWDSILKNNLRSVFLCSREAARVMISQKRGGNIINLSSIHAVISEPSAGAYTAAKGGIEAFSRTIAAELAPHKIRVNYIRPGATYTELTIPMYTDSVKKALYSRVPMKEIAQPEWIASTAVFLASDDSRYMTGEGITVDGGYIMDGSLPGAEYWK
jgi:NAD(P)-dependent dehydrogenase (short-subunit alcohol dehydrogenase family)